MRKLTKNNLITIAGTAVLFAVMAVLSQGGMLNNKINGLIVPIGIYVIFAVSLNLTVGVLGELSLGHAGFMFVGAYVSGAVSLIMQNSPNISAPGWLRFVLAIIAGGIMAAVFGILIGIPVLRLRGDYLAIVTLGFGEIIRSLANNIFLVIDGKGIHFGFTQPPAVEDGEVVEVLRGPLGMAAPQDTNIWIVTVVLLVCLAILMMFIDSKSGRACMAVRDNYIAAQSVGVSVTKFRLIAFTISATMAGVAGALYSHSISLTAAKKFDYNLSILILVFVVLGGLGSMRGSIIATIILYALPELFREVGNYRMLIYAIVLILMMLWKNAPFFISLRERMSAKFKKNRESENTGGAEV